MKLRFYICWYFFLYLFVAHQLFVFHVKFSFFFIFNFSFLIFHNSYILVFSSAYKSTKKNRFSLYLCVRFSFFIFFSFVYNFLWYNCCIYTRVTCLFIFSSMFSCLLFLKFIGFICDKYGISAAAIIVPAAQFLRDRWRRRMLLWHTIVLLFTFAFASIR